ncbi:MAG TPA: alpha/beta fold hydrolase [Rhodanobacteraceae bacterium]
MPVLPTIERETGANPAHSLIFLHGLGADGNDFAPIVPELVVPGWPAVRFVFPDAPVRPVSLNGGMPMRAWYDLKSLSVDGEQDEAGIRQAIDWADALIAREAERGIAPDHVVLAGFSQGGAIALAAGLRHAQKLAGIVALSTYLPLHEQTAAELAEANRATPIFQGHGLADPVVVPPLGDMTHAWLDDHGYAVERHTYSMGHQVIPAEIADLRDWLTLRLGG